MWGSANSSSRWWNLIRFPLGFRVGQVCIKNDFRYLSRVGITTASGVTNVKVLELDKYSFDECYKGSEIHGSSPDCMVHGQLKQKNSEDNSGDSVVMNDSAMNSAISSPDRSKTYSLSSICSLSELSLMDKHPYDSLKVELDAIDMQFHQRFLELLKRQYELRRKNG